MKRAISGDFQRRCGLGAGLIFAISLAACTAPPTKPAQETSGAASWVTTPLIKTAQRTPSGLMLRGVTAPAGRVVVRGQAGVAYATSADEQGRFALRIASPATDTLFVVETQIGQEAAPAPYRLLVTRDVGGPIALLTAGGPSLRLDPTGPLDVIDSDGRAWLASGRGGLGQNVSVSTAGRTAIEIPVQPDGRWVAPMQGGAPEISVGGQSYVRPNAGRPEAVAGLTVTPVSGGYLVIWPTSDAAPQSSWFPDRQASN